LALLLILCVFVSNLKVSGNVFNALFKQLIIEHEKWFKLNRIQYRSFFLNARRHFSFYTMYVTYLNSHNIPKCLSYLFESNEIVTLKPILEFLINLILFSEKRRRSLKLITIFNSINLNWKCCT
jgi:hypothetical protein